MLYYNKLYYNVAPVGNHPPSIAEAVGVTAILQTKSSRSNILRVAILGELPVFAILSLQNKIPTESNSQACGMSVRKNGPYTL